MNDNLTSVKFSIPISIEIGLNYYYKRFVISSLKKFLNRQYGCISKHNKKINKILLDNGIDNINANYIFGMYKSIIFGKILIMANSANIIITEIPYECATRVKIVFNGINL